MCTGIEIAAIASATAATAGAYTSYEASQDAKHERGRMEGERRKAESDAVNRAQAKTQMQRKALRDNSLFTGAGEAGRTTLGV